MFPRWDRTDRASAISPARCHSMALAGPHPGPKASGICTAVRSRDIARAAARDGLLIHPCEKARRPWKVQGRSIRELRRMASEPNDITLSFEGALGVRTIETMRRTLLDGLCGATSVAIDCTAVKSADLSFIQLLLAARLSAEAAGKRLELATPLPDVLSAALKQGGFLAAAENTRLPTLSGTAAHEQSHPLPSMTSASVLQMVKLTLTGAGYQVVQAANGAEGLAKARGEPLDMVLTDLNMPVMNGIAMIRELRKLPTCIGVPIIFLTTESDARHEAARPRPPAPPAGSPSRSSRTSCLPSCARCSAHERPRSRPDLSAGSRGTAGAARAGAARPRACAPTTTLIDTAFRALHTIKGSGAMFGFDAVAAFTHHVRDRVRPGAQGSGGGRPPELIAVALAAKDQIRRADRAARRRRGRRQRRHPGRPAGMRGGAEGGPATRRLEPRRPPPRPPPPGACASGCRATPWRWAPTRCCCSTNCARSGTATVRRRRLRRPAARRARPDRMPYRLGRAAHHRQAALGDRGGVPVRARRHAARHPGRCRRPRRPEADRRATATGRHRGRAQRPHRRPATPAARPATARADSGAGPRIAGSIRVPAERLDELMDRVGELVIAQSRLKQVAAASNDAAGEVGRRGNRAARAGTARHHDGRAHGADRPVVRPLPPAGARPRARTRQGDRARHRPARRPSSTRR